MKAKFMAALTWPLTQWISRLWLDPLIVLMVVGVHGFLVAKDQVPSLLAGTDIGQRPALYGAAAIVLSLTGTLGSVSVAQYLQARGQRARELKKRHPAVLGRSWKLIFVSTITGSLLFLSAYRADLRPTSATGSGSSVGEWLFEVGVVVALVALARLVYLFGQLVDLIVLDDTDPLGQTIALNTDFFSATPTTLPSTSQAASTPVVGPAPRKRSSSKSGVTPQP